MHGSQCYVTTTAGIHHCLVVMMPVSYAWVRRFESPLDPQMVWLCHYINVWRCGGLSMVLLQIFIQRMGTNFWSVPGFLSHREVTEAVESDVKTYSFLPSFLTTNSYMRVRHWNSIYVGWVGYFSVKRLIKGSVLLEAWVWFLLADEYVENPRITGMIIIAFPRRASLGWLLLPFRGEHPWDDYYCLSAEIIPGMITIAFPRRASQGWLLLPFRR